MGGISPHDRPFCWWYVRNGPLSGGRAQGRQDDRLRLSYGVTTVRGLSMRLRHILTMISVAALSASTVVVGAATASAATTNVVVRPGALDGWRVDFLTSSVRPGFVTGPATAPLGEGSFRFDTGAPGAAAAGAKVELSNGGLNDQPVANLTGLRFDAYVEENDDGASEAALPEPQGRRRQQRQHRHHADLQPHRDPAERLDGGRHPRRHRHRSVRLVLHVSTVVTCRGGRGITWAQVLEPAAR